MRAYQAAAGGTVVGQLADHVEVGHQCRLKDERHVRRVQQLDRVTALLPSVLLVLDLPTAARYTVGRGGERRVGGGGGVLLVAKIKQNNAFGAFRLLLIVLFYVFFTTFEDRAGSYRNRSFLMLKGR